MEKNRFLITARFDPETVTRESRAVRVLISNEQPVLKSGDGEPYYQILSHAPGAVDLSRVPLPLLVNHDANELPLGTVTDVTLHNGELRGIARFGTSPRAQELFAQVMEKSITNVSVGGHAITMSESAPEQWGDPPSVFYEKWQPVEVSVVSVGAIGAARFLNSGAFKMPDENAAPAAPTTHPALEAERARIAAITARCKEVGRPEIALSMIESGADLEATNAAIVESWVAQGGPEIRQAVSVYPTRSRSDQFANAIESALSARLGIRNAGAPREFQHMSLTQIAGTVIESSGGSARGLNPDRLIRNAMTSSDFPSLLGSAVNRALVAQFQELANEHRQLVATRDLNDFKPGKSISVSAFPSLQEKPEAAEITYSSLTDNAETIQLKTFARGLSLSREALVNDDLNGLTRAVQSAALAAIRLERDLVFGALIANPKLSDEVALFSAGHANIETGDLDLTGLSAARAKMRKQRDRDGNYIVVKPSMLVVPTALETAAEALVASLLTKSETRESAAPSWITSLTVVTDPRLDADSESTWYLLASPISAPVLELAFLQGVQAPIVEESPDFDSDTLRVKVRYDVGLAPIDHRGAVRVTAS